MQLIFDGPLNSLSFGNVSFNILRELFRGGHEVGLFLSNKDIAAYPVTEGFKQWLEHGINIKWKLLGQDTPVLKLWHLNGSEKALSNRQTLLSFYECSDPTETEISICNRQKNTIFSSSYAAKLFADAGGKSVSNVHIGFDEDFRLTDKKYLPDDVIHFGLMGKFERRKHTEKIIKLWLSKYGNDNRYLLSCCVTNPFFKPEQMQQILTHCLGGKTYTNINFLPYLPSNQEVNEFMNSIDVDLTGISLAEGWNLPSFNSTCLGKWSIVGNHTGHQDWANSDNSILIEPDGVIECYDKVFFSKGQLFNQGNFFIYHDDVVVSAMEKAVEKAKTPNQSGLDLSKIMTYSSMVDKLLINL